MTLDQAAASLPAAQISSLVSQRTVLLQLLLHQLSWFCTLHLHCELCIVYSNLACALCLLQCFSRQQLSASCMPCARTGAPQCYQQEIDSVQRGADGEGVLPESGLVAPFPHLHTIVDCFLTSLA